MTQNRQARGSPKERMGRSLLLDQAVTKLALAGTEAALGPWVTVPQPRSLVGLERLVVVATRSLCRNRRHRYRRWSSSRPSQQWFRERVSQSRLPRRIQSPRFWVLRALWREPRPAARPKRTG